MNGIAGKFNPFGGLGGGGGGLGGLGGLAGLAGLAGVGAGIAAGLGKAVMAASDLNEQVSKSDVVFGAASAGVIAEAERMAAAFGVPKSEFIDAASSIGLIGKASGLTQGAAADLGTEFAKLGIDASSFYNVPLNDALMAIRSGLVGESEPMRRFGVLLSAEAVAAEAARMGLAKLGETLTEGMKVQARAALIAKGMADAHGDMERTADGAANRIRSMWGHVTNSLANVGTAIAPATNGVLGLGNGLASLAETVTGAGATLTSGFFGRGPADLSELGRVGTGALAQVEKKTQGVAAASQVASKEVEKLLEKYRTDFLKGGDAGALVARAGGTPDQVDEARQLERLTEKATVSDKASDLQKKLQQEIDTFHMGGDAAAVYALKKAGASDVTLGYVGVLAKELEGLNRTKALLEEQGAAAERVFEEARTPVEKLGDELERLQDLRIANQISPETFARARENATAAGFKMNATYEKEAGPAIGSVLDASSLQRSIQQSALGGGVAEKTLSCALESKKELVNINKVLNKKPANPYAIYG